MPARNDHLCQANHNCNLVSTISNHGNIITDSTGAPFADWHTTISFYAALHFLEAFIAGGILVLLGRSAVSQRIRHSSDLKAMLRVDSEHSIRKTILIHNSGVGKVFPSDVRNSFLTLYENSRHARYDCYRHDCFCPKDAEMDLMTVEQFCTA